MIDLYNTKTLGADRKNTRQADKCIMYDSVIAYLSENYMSATTRDNDFLVLKLFA